jgi:hypothetical protein
VNSPKVQESLSAKSNIYSDLIVELTLHAARAGVCKERRRIWRLQKASENGRVTLTLCGRLEGGLLAELRKIFESEGRQKEVVLDLKEVKLVDVEVVAFRANCESEGVRLENCPAYVRAWMLRVSATCTWIRG